MLLVAGALLAGAATVAAVPALGERVVRTVRTGLCIVGGDVCRRADAAAAGLEPCLTAERSWRQETTIDLAVVRLGGDGEWQLALQSDGTAVVTRLEESAVGGTVGIGLGFSPLDAGGSPAADADPEASAAGARLAGTLVVETDERRWSQPEVVGLGVVSAAASVFFGIYPSPLLDLAHDAGAVFTGLF